MQISWTSPRPDRTKACSSSHSGSSFHMMSRTKSLMSDHTVALSRSVVKVKDESSLRLGWIKAATVICSCTGAFFRGESSPNGSEAPPHSTDIPTRSSVSSSVISLQITRSTMMFVNWGISIIIRRTREYTKRSPFALQGISLYDRTWA